MTVPLVSTAEALKTNPHHARRWLILAVLGIAQLMVVLDATIVNVALPSAQESLGFSGADRQWVITSYALAFGSLLPLGGRLSDLWGRKKMFVAGLFGFAVASIIAGAAQNFEMLIAARVLQGIAGALLAPAALSLLNATFTDPSERNKAFSVFGAIGGAGGAVGLLLGGALTDYMSWRWTMYVNVAFVAVALIGAVALLVNESHPIRPRLDLPGTVTASLGLFGIVFGFSKAETDGWGAGVTVGSLLAGVVFLAVFLVIQRYSKHPLLPLRILADRNRGASFLSLALGAVGLYGVFLFLAFYLQLNLGYSPVKTGLAFLALPIAMTVAAGLALTKLGPRFGPKPVTAAGLAIAAVGAALLAQLGVQADYATDLLPGLVILGVGLGASLATGLSASTLGVHPDDAGAAGAMANTSQQVGSAIGLALLSTLAASASEDYLVGKTPDTGVLAHAAVEGYTTAFWWAAGIFAVSSVVTGLLYRRGVPVQDPDAPVVIGH